MPVHHLVTGSWTPPGALFTLSFDDETHELKLLKRTALPEDEPISWLTKDHIGRNLYGAALKRWNSLRVDSPTDIVHEGSHPIGGDPSAPLSTTRTRAIFLLAASQPPHAVYCAPFYEHAGYGNAFSVSPTGTLEANIQNFEYAPESAIHGAVFNPPETHLYSADMWGDKIWVHVKDSDGTLTTVGSVDTPKGTHPRWVEMHPSGTVLYTLMEAANTLVEYTIPPQTHLPTPTGQSFPLVPPSLLSSNPKLYRGDVCALSASARTLFATTRSNDRNTPGFITALAVGPDGRITQQRTLQHTLSSGGHSNAVVPAPWDEGLLALTDDVEAVVEVWRWEEGPGVLYRVAREKLGQDGAGMNVVWLD
ncbi:3-carboxy-cis,cis-mucoante lactonizing enzyme [Trichodelitschia bisporula]|uniref:3-carboxy-cis,cis-mucoante lactonizing enzyme n=1 Tax=Trichodelitschia bisporula TaxID=703511 RepID=A0A6G1HPW3_9PEZI|nr:3-carboxy-cis,cis-mucoante lactonizing enzyme [Trichodelitschia bisporula]